MLLVTLAVAWVNFLFTTRWAALPGALNGWKRPWFAAALIVATVLAVLVKNPGQRVKLQRVWVTTAAGAGLLAWACFVAFPPGVWRLIPFEDDWPPRYQATVDGVRLLASGAVNGWNWLMLGGHQMSADLSQSLTFVAAPLMALFGDAFGYHLVHVLLLFAIPCLVYFDLSRDEPEDVAQLAAAFTFLTTIGFFWTLIKQGDTNSIVGVACAVLAMAGSRQAEAGRRWGGPLQVIGLTLALYTHAGFFLYTSSYLVVESCFYRNRRMFIRLIIAAATAFLAALPLYWELLRYPAYFATNNILYAPAPIDWPSVLRRIYYNFELSLLPHRWFNDYGGLTSVMLAVIIFVAVKARGRRPGFYAWCGLLTVGLLGLDVVEFGGYLLAREFHMLAVFTPVVLAWFIVEQSGHRALAWALVAVVGLYAHCSYLPVRHVASVRDFDPALVDRLATLDGALVLLEGNPHRDLIVDPAERPEPTPWSSHFDSMLATATGRRYYAQTWDGFHWTPFRGQTVAGGSFRGQRIDKTPVDDFVAEMRKWGVRHLVVWSKVTTAYLDSAPNRFDRRWSQGRWAQYEMRDADVRDVVVRQGSGRLTALHPLGGVVGLTGMAAGQEVIVRTNYFPAWSARSGSANLPLRSAGGQLAFDAPAEGTYDVILEYPRRTGLIALSLLAFLTGCATSLASSTRPSAAVRNRPRAR